MELRRSETEKGLVPALRNLLEVAVPDTSARSSPPRAGREMLSTDEGIEVVGEAENGREAVALAEKLEPDVVLLDVEMPVMGAGEAMERMLDRSSPPRVIIVTMHDNPGLVRDLIGLGASAYLVKSATMRSCTRRSTPPPAARLGT